MKVICKCCHRSFDYDMYMGLCPKCGRVYRRGKEHYSAVEKDMMGEFHLHADEGGLNRGIHGVVYNQASKPENEILDLAPVAAPARPATSNARVYTQAGSSQSRPVQSNPYYKQVSAAQRPNQNISNQARPNNQAGGNTRIITADIINAMKAERGQGYYSPNHGTKMNQGVNGKKDASASVVTIVVVVVIILSMLMSMFD